MTSTVAIMSAPGGGSEQIYELSEAGDELTVRKVTNGVLSSLERRRVYPKLSSDEYSYRLTATTGRRVGDNPGVKFYLCQTSTNKVKVFFQAGHVEDLTSMISHMNSLTDDLCSQWFNERVKKGKAAK